MEPPLGGTLQPENVAIGIGDAGERHPGHVLSALENSAAGGRIVEDADGDIGAGNAGEDNSVAPKDLLKAEGVAVEANGFLHVAHKYDEEQRRDLRHQIFPSARSTRSGVIGTSVSRAPVASATALATAAAPATMDGSPTMRAPYGPSSEGTSTIIASIGGRSRVVGMR